MAIKSMIEWTETTWNPVTGCTRVSPGCDNCYAARMSFRLENMGRPSYVGLTSGIADVTHIVEIIRDRTKRERIKALATKTGRNYDTARKAWSKYGPVAEQQLKARETKVITS